MNTDNNRSYLLEVIASKDKEMLELATKVGTLEEELEKSQKDSCISDEVKSALTDVLDEAVELKSIINDFNFSFSRLDSALNRLSKCISDEIDRPDGSMQKGLNIAYDYFVLKLPVTSIIEKYKLKSSASVYNYTSRIKKVILEDAGKWKPGSKCYAIYCNIESRAKKLEAKKAVEGNNEESLSESSDKTDEQDNLEVSELNEEHVEEKEKPVEEKSSLDESNDKGDSLKEEINSFLSEWTSEEVEKYFSDGYSITELASIFDTSEEIMKAVVESFSWYETVSDEVYERIMAKENTRYDEYNNIVKDFNLILAVAKHLTAARKRMYS